MDRRIVLAVFLMMVVAVVPALIFKAPPRPVTTQVADSGAVAAKESTAAPSRPAAAPVTPPAPVAHPSALRPTHPPVGDTVVVSSALYRYVFDVRGARLVRAELLKYPDGEPGVKPGPVDLVRPGDGLFGLTLVTGADSTSLEGWSFTPSTKTLSPATGGAGSPLTFTATEGHLTVSVTYTFRADGYRFDVQGKVTGLGPTGGVLLVGLGGGVPLTEVDTSSDGRYHALVVKPLGKSTSLTPFYKIDPGTSRAVPGPFSWVASKSKYFVIGLFAPDTTQRWAAATASVPAGIAKYSGIANLRLSQPLLSSGGFRYTAYAGPMEYNRLTAMGDDFNDVNPYGIIGFRMSTGSGRRSARRWSNTRASRRSASPAAPRSAGRSPHTAGRR